MNPEIPKTPGEELEARLTALLLGELPADEAFALGRAIERDAELAGLYSRLKETVGLVKEATVTPASSCNLKLSPTRREKLLAEFKTVRPKQFPDKERSVRPWIRVLAAAAVLMFLGIFAQPFFVRPRTKSQSSATEFFEYRQAAAPRRQVRLDNEGQPEPGKKGKKELFAQEKRIAQNEEGPRGPLSQTEVLPSASVKAPSSVDAAKSETAIILPAAVDASTTLSTGDPQWIGVLEKPLSSSNNVFATRYPYNPQKPEIDLPYIADPNKNTFTRLTDDRALQSNTSPNVGWLGTVTTGEQARAVGHAWSTPSLPSNSSSSLAGSDAVYNKRSTGSAGTGDQALRQRLREALKTSGDAFGGGDQVSVSKSASATPAPPTLRNAIVLPSADARGLALGKDSNSIVTAGAREGDQTHTFSEQAAFRRRYGVGGGAGGLGGPIQQPAPGKDDVSSRGARFDSIASKPVASLTPVDIDPTAGLPVDLARGLSINSAGGSVDPGTGLPVTPPTAAAETVEAKIENLGKPLIQASELAQKDAAAALKSKAETPPTLGDVPVIGQEFRGEPKPAQIAEAGLPAPGDSVAAARDRESELGYALDHTNADGTKHSGGLGAFYSGVLKNTPEQIRSGSNNISSLNVVGYVNVDLTNGFSLIADQLNQQALPIPEKERAYADAKRNLEEQLRSRQILNRETVPERIDTNLVARVESEEVIPAGVVNFAVADLNEVLKIYSELVGRKLIVPENLPGTPIRLKPPGPLTKTQAVQALEGVLAINGLAAVNVGGEFTKIVSSAQAAATGAKFNKEPVQQLAEPGQQVTEVIQLHNMKPTELVTVLGRSNEISNSALPIDNSGILVLRDSSERIKRLSEIVAKLDSKRTDSDKTLEEKVTRALSDDPQTTKRMPTAEPQPEVQTRENAYSTFSLNVSDVSFKLATASLEKGQMPEPGSVRSEEFINAFDYRDPEPAPGAPIAFAWERARYPFVHNRDLLRFSVKTAAAGRQAGRPLNIVLLLDDSGSMERADRVRIIREALRVLAGQLQTQDKFSVVTFARTPRLWVDGVSGDQAGIVAEEVNKLTPQGGTNLEEAMNLAYQTAARHYLPNGINRVVLLTDGAANLGEVEPESLKQKVEAQRKQGIALDCFGIGWEGFNDDLLEVLSRNGDGRYGFINTPEEAATEFAGQLAGALHVAASDVKVQVEFNPARVTAYRQIGYAKHQLTKEQFRDNTVDAAEIGAAESGNALYVIEVNPNGEGPIATVRVRFKVPGTSDYREHEWAVPYIGNAVALEHAGPAMRLAASASAFSEWLAGSPYASEVTPERLLGYLNGVPEVSGADTRPKKLEWMIRQAKSVAGNAPNSERVRLP